MHDIIPIIEFGGHEGIQAVDAWALYESLFGEDLHNNRAKWAAKNITGNEFAVRGEDWVYVQSDVNPQGGRPSQNIHLRLDFAKKLGMMARSDRGEEIRDYFIAVEKRAREAFQIPKTLSAALLLASQQAAQIEAQAPLVAFAEKVQGSPSTFGVDETAKAFGAPVKAFREFVQRKYQFRRGRSILPLEEYGPNGRKWFEIKTRTYDHAGVEMTYHVSHVTGLGQIKLRDAWERSQAVAVQA